MSGLIEPECRRCGEYRRQVQSERECAAKQLATERTAREQAEKRIAALERAARRAVQYCHDNHVWRDEQDMLWCDYCEDPIAAHAENCWVGGLVRALDAARKEEG